jgi:hypothetical protein
MAIRPILRKAAWSQIDWPVVGLAAAIAGVLVLSTTLMAWMASRSVISSRSPIGLRESSTGATPSVEAVRSQAERGNEEPIQQGQAALYPEGNEQGAASEDPFALDRQPKGQASHLVPKGNDIQRPAANEVVFAKDPTAAAELAKREHKLMFVLHVSGNFEESKFT